MSMRIAFFSTQPYDKTYFDRFNEQHEIVYFEAALNADTLPLAAGFESVCVFVNDKLDPTVINGLARLKIQLIVLRCAGFNNVDLSTATMHGIPVLRVPAYSPHAVAEHAVALILTLNRKTHKAYNRIREGNFSLDKLQGFDLHGKTVGVVGTGKIGEIFATIMQGFGCQILAYDPFPSKVLQQKGIPFTDLETLLKNAHIVSLHCPLTEQTHHLIDEKSICQMKKGAMLINTSRGGLVDAKAVVQSLRSHHLGSLAIDVYEQESGFFFYDRSEEIIQDETLLLLMNFPNVLITSHQGFFTEEALVQIAQTTLQNISDFEKGTLVKQNIAE